jgi:plastocyanin
MHRLALISIALVGCSTDDGRNTPPLDARADAAPVANVVALDRCPATVKATIMDSPTAFIPKAVTVSPGDVVRFDIAVEHLVIPNTLVPTDDVLRVGKGETKCFQLNKVGTYGFLCGIHSFTGVITVE